MHVIIISFVWIGFVSCTFDFTIYDTLFSLFTFVSY